MESSGSAQEDAAGKDGIREIEAALISGGASVNANLKLYDLSR